MTPPVSVCIPTRNHSDGLRRTLENITNQSYRDLEILVSDNCSSDDTPYVIQEYAKKDPRIRHFRQETNIGVLYNYKFLGDKATGKYLMWAQDDDEWTPTFIENLVDALEQNPEAEEAVCPTCYRNNKTLELSSVYSLDSLSPYKTVGNGEMGFGAMGIWKRESYLKFEDRSFKPGVSGIDHTTTAHAIMCGGIVVVTFERYTKGFWPGRFDEAFSVDPLYSFRAWYYLVKVLATSPYIPAKRKLAIPAIAATNLFRACAITGVSVLVSMPDNPVKRLIQSRFYGVN